MTDVVYTANEGYYFPTDYSVTDVNGISVTRDSYTQITVSGIPTADATITLANATAKENQNPPETTGLTVTNATNATSADGVISGVTTAMEYSLDNGASWTAVTGTSITGLNPGDVQIRLKGDDTHNASEAVTVAVGDAALISAKTTATETVNGVDANDYITADQETVTNAKTTALAAINAATTEDEVTAAMATFNNDIAACTTQAVADQIAQVMSEVTAKTGSGMTYTGSPIQLINTPTTALPDGYTMKYAVTTEATAPTDDNLYTTSIPTATDAGTYYVWYIVKGDDNHKDTAAACVTVTIASADSGSGSPEEGALVYNGSAQELVKGGSVVGGTLKYALGSNAAQAPVDGWSENVPEVADAGTYFVWYRIDGDQNHNGTAPACVIVTILKAPAPGTVEEKQKASALAPVYNGKAQALVRTPGSLPEGYTKTRYSTNNGKSWSDALPKGTKAGSYPVLVKYTGDKNHEDFTYGPLNATISKAKITITAQNKKTTRGKALAKLTWKVSGADASGDKLGIKLSTTAKKTAKAGKYPISVTWNKNPNYSATIKKGTYTLADAILSTEKKAAKIRMNAGLNVDWNGSGVLVKWGDTPDAESYEVWAAYCGKDSPSKKIGTLGAGENSFRFTSLGKKELNPKKSIKVTVLAYRKVNGKKTKIANTITAHAVIDTNPVYSNAAKITLTRSKFSLKAGRTARIKTGEILADKKKKSLGKGHALTFRYASSKDSVATVDKNGTITAVGRGTCTVYVYARNGRARKISVTVK